MRAASGQPPAARARRGGARDAVRPVATARRRSLVRRLRHV